MPDFNRMLLEIAKLLREERLITVEEELKMAQIIQNRQDNTND